MAIIVSCPSPAYIFLISFPLWYCNKLCKMDLAYQLWQQINISAPMYPLLLPFLLLIPLMYLLHVNTRSSKLNLPPSPPKLPIIGNFHQVGGTPHINLTTLANKYGPVMLIQYGYKPTLIVSSAEVVSEIMKISDVPFSDRPQTVAGNVVSNGYLDVAFGPHDDLWRDSKKICVVELLSQKKVEAFHSTREVIVVNMLEKIRSSCRSKSSMNLQELFVAFSNNLISRAALGRVYERKDGRESFGELAKRTVDFLGTFCFEDWFPYLGWIDSLTGYRPSLKRTTGDLYEFLDEVIKEHQVSGDQVSDQTKDFVHVLLDLQKNNKGLSRDRIKAIIMDMFLGGTATTSVALEWSMAELVKNPSKMRKCQEEVRRVVGKNKSKVEESDVTKMEYLKCVVKETLRLHPGSPLAPRFTNGCTKLGGYDVPPNINMMINIWAIQRDPKYWEKPDDFIPERFQDKSIDYVDQTFKYLPFGVGRRICPGMSFAGINVEFALANLLYWFDWVMPEGEQAEELDMTEIFAFVNRKKMPLHLVPLMYVD